MTDDAKPKRKSKGQSPTARSLALCRKRGWLADKVEQRLPRGFVTKDLFGFIDAVALDGQPGLLGIQATGGRHGANRVTKIALECGAAALRWLGAGNRVEVWNWEKQGAAGSRKLWTLRAVEVTAAVILAEQGRAQQLERARQRATAAAGGVQESEPRG